MAAHPQHQGSIALLLTSDEEGVAVDGTVRVVEKLKARGELLDYCIVGEPTAVNQLGDTIKNGRRGSLSGKLIVKGVQGHVAYPHLVKNPVHLFAPAWPNSPRPNGIAAMRFFRPPAGRFPISTAAPAPPMSPRTASRCNSISATPRRARPRPCAAGCMPSSTGTGSITRSTGCMPRPLSSPPRASWSLPCAPRCASVTGIEAELSTTGGTSDGRFIIDICPQVLELGPVNASIHKLNEHIELDALDALKSIYRQVLERLLLPA